jgi:hypothetical protein
MEKIAICLFEQPSAMAGRAELRQTRMGHEYSA